MSETMFDALLIVAGAVPVALAWAITAWTTRRIGRVPRLPERPQEPPAAASPLLVAWRGMRPGGRVTVGAEVAVILALITLVIAGLTALGQTLPRTADTVQLESGGLSR